jgi:TolB protein
LRKRYTLAILLLGAVLIALVVVLRLPALESSAHPGRLVFTDFPKPNHNFTVDIFDLEQNTRSSLLRTAYNDVGSVAPIDEQHIYASMCFATNNPMFFCSAYVSDIFAPEQVSRFDDVKQFWKESYSSPIWSPDGTRLAFILMRGYKEEFLSYRGDTFVMNADGSNLLDLTPEEDNNGFSFTWSPDSQQIAFACGDEQYLCIADANASNLRQITVPQNTRVRDLAWSPDGTQIVFALLDRDFRNSEIYVVNADGSNVHRLLEAEFNFHEEPVWSPDGSKVVFRSGEQRNNIGEIYVIEADGTNLHNLSQSLDGSEFAATWSPDGTKVAFFSSQSKGMFLYIAQADGTNLQQITDNSTWDLTDVGSPELFWIP